MFQQSLALQWVAQFNWVMTSAKTALQDFSGSSLGKVVGLLENRSDLSALCIVDKCVKPLTPSPYSHAQPCVSNPQLIAMWLKNPSTSETLLPETMDQLKQTCLGTE